MDALASEPAPMTPGLSAKLYLETQEATALGPRRPGHTLPDRARRIGKRDGRASVDHTDERPLRRARESNRIHHEDLKSPTTSDALPVPTMDRSNAEPQ